jgi:hypothetical protein
MSPKRESRVPARQPRDVRKAEYAGGVEIVAEDGGYAAQSALLAGRRVHRQ